MTNVIFSFDTEDYVNEYAAEGIIRTARILRENGIKGCYQTVGMLAEALSEWGRSDIINELSLYHEVDYHSHRHSMHPTINEYTDIADYSAARRRFLEDESVGMKKVKQIMGVDSLLCACPPGNSNSYVARYAYADMGVNVYTGDQLYDAVSYRPIYNCNLMSVRHHNVYLENILFDIDEVGIDEYVAALSDKHTVVLSHHPQRGYTSTFCDLENYNGVNTPRSQWIITEPYSAERTEKFYKNYAYLVKAVKKNANLRTTTYNELFDSMAEGERKITRQVLLGLKPQLESCFFPVTSPDSYCIADVFYACREFLLSDAERCVCGRVYGFLSTPYSVKEPISVTRSELCEAARSIFLDEFLPEYLWAGDKKIGPADFIRASFDVLSGKESALIMPDMPWQIDMDQFPEVRDLSYRNTWIHSRALEDNYLSDRLRLQSWTFRLPKGTERKIFAD